MRTIIIIIFTLLSISLFAQELVYVKPGAQVIIGDTMQVKVRPGYNLFVENGVLTEKVKVALHNTAQWSDDAFDKKPDIVDVEEHINLKSHLLGMPSAKHLVKEGYEITDMDSKLLRQIEWLWMEMIAIKKENDVLKNELQSIKQQLKD